MNNSDYWGAPRHDLPMTHAMPNPTNSYHDPGIGGGVDWSTPVSMGAPGGGSFGAGGAINYGTPFATGLYAPKKRLIPLAVALAFLFGPLGLFYVSVLNGIAALIVLPFVVRSLAFAVAALLHGGIDMVYTVAVPILWCVAIPWAIIASKIRNNRIDRAA